jgi:hypothetical protein
MAIRSDSFSSAAEVTAFTRHLLDGQTAFNSTSRPTVTELEKFIDRASGLVNTALAKAGFTPSSIYANSTAKLTCDDWVTNYAARYVELTQRGTGYSENEGGRLPAFELGTADEFVMESQLGFIRLGISQNIRASQGLTFTGLTAQADRTDPQDASREQPLFSRKNYDNPAITRLDEDDDVS